MARLSQIAVYYPYIHFRDANWLKIAALYWPRMVRIVHPDYPTRNSALVEVLQGELGFVVDHSPASAAQAMVESFTELVNTLPVERFSAWRLPRELGGQDPREMSLPEPPEPLVDGCVPELEHYGPREWAGPDQLAEGIRAGALAGVHTSEVAPQLATVLLDTELAVPARGSWYAMHPQLAWIYKCRLTEELARRNNLVATTDQMSAHAVMSGPLELGVSTGTGSHERSTIADTLGLLSIAAVVPRGIDDVPVEKIVEVRRRFGGQFDRWREYIDAVGADLAEQLGTVESPIVLNAYLSDAVARYAKAPLEDLRRGLVDVGLDGADSAVNSKFELPAGLAATALLAQPQLAMAGGVALGAMRLRRATSSKARAVRTAPSAYLLSVQETFEPKTWLSRVIGAVRRASGLSN
jgi:hypothetical protein